MDEFIGRRIEDEVVKGKVFRDGLTGFYFLPALIFKVILNFAALSG